MKFLFLIVLLLLGPVAAPAMDCPSISGAYRWEGDGASTLLILSQQGCGLVKLEMDPGEGTRVKRDLIPDGARRPLGRGEGVDAVEWSDWREGGLNVHLEEHYLRQNVRIGTHARWSLSSNGDLIEDLDITRDGSSIYRAQAVYRRQE